MGAASMMGSFMSMAGSAVSASAAQSQGTASAQADYANANLESTQAQETLDQTTNNEYKLAVSSRAQIGAETAGYGAAGVTESGSAMDVLRASTAMAEFDKLNLQTQGDNKAAALFSESTQNQNKAQYDLAAGSSKATSDILSGATSASSAFPSIAGPSSSGSSGGGGGSYGAASGADIGSAAGSFGT